METTSTNTFLNLWNNSGPILGYLSAGFACMALLYLGLTLLLTKDFKAKYDFINRYEIKLLMNASLFLFIGVGLLVNSLTPQTDALWLGVKLFITLTLGFIAQVFVSSYLKYYHPFSIEKRLKKLRETPRISPKSHKPMTLVKELKNKVYLDEETLSDDDIFSVDYDVWVDKASGYMKIEKYNGHLHALSCNACNYQTLKVNKEEVVVPPTLKNSGTLIKFYQCSYCHNETQRVFSIAKLRHNYRDNSRDTISLS